MKYLVYTITSFFFTAVLCSAASITVDMEQTLTTGAQATVDILLDPEGENINSVELNIAFPSTVLSFAGYTAQMDSIPLWIKVPTLVSPGIIHLSGIIPGGLERRYDPKRPNDRTLPLVRLLFMPSTQGHGSVSLQKPLLLRNDGKGTQVTVTTMAASFSVEKGNDETFPQRIEDTVIPEVFSITVLKKSRFGQTPRLAIFDARDNESGIERYEVKVGREEFRIAESSYPLPSRIFGYSFTVRAFDYGGNFREIQTTIPGVITFIKALIALAVATAIVIYIAWRKRKSHHEINA